MKKIRTYDEFELTINMTERMKISNLSLSERINNISYKY